MQDTSHLSCLYERLGRERERLSDAKSQKETAFRRVQVDQAKREVASEMARLGMPSTDGMTMSDDDLLTELGL